MPDQDTQELIDAATMILTVDGQRNADDPFKLTQNLHDLVENRLANLQGATAGVSLEEGDRGLASGDLRTALNALETLLRDGYSFIVAIPSFQLTPAERRQVFVTYGWTQGELGEFTDRRIVTLADLAINNTPRIENTAYRYPTVILERIEAQREQVRLLAPDATTGEREGAVDERDDDRTLLQKAVSRVRHFYCQASDEVDQTPELSKIGFQPRRAKGTVRRTKSKKADDAANGTTNMSNPA